MAHFAEIEDNTVIRVLRISDEHEHRGQEFLARDLKLGGEWIQCSYNSALRKQFPGIGYTYDSESDVFISPKPYPSWILDDNHDWQAPVERPQDELHYCWNESNLSWEEEKEEQ